MTAGESLPAVAILKVSLPGGALPGVWAVAETVRLTAVLVGVLVLGLLGVVMILALGAAWRRAIRREREAREGRRGRAEGGRSGPKSEAGGGGSASSGDPWRVSAERVRVDTRLEGMEAWDEAEPPPGWDHDGGAGSEPEDGPPPGPR